MNKLSLLLCLALPGFLVAGLPLRAAPAGDNPTAYTALRLVGKELGADSLGRIVAVGGREGVPQPFVWRITLAAKPGGTTTGAREIEVAGGRIVANRPARENSSSAVTIDLKNLNLDSSGAFTTADAESRQRRLPFSALNYELRADPAADDRPAWTVQLLDGDHRPLGSLILAATDGTMIRATGQLAEGASSRTSAVVASNSPEERPPRVPPPRRRGDSARQPREITPRPPEPEDADGGGGFLERAGRTLDRTPGRVVRAVEETPGHIEQGVRRAGARVGVGIQRFFDPDARPPASPE